MELPSSKADVKHDWLSDFERRLWNTQIRNDAIV